MSTFINFDVSGKIPLKFFWKHIWFSFLWIVGFALLIFRIDILALEQFDRSITWIRMVLPAIYLLIFSITFIIVKWYYKIALIIYPFLLVFWFIPKTVLSRGKIYLFGKYLTSIYNKLKYFNRTVIHFFLFSIPLILFLSFSAPWAKWLMLVVVTYFYLRFVFLFVKNSFKPPALFGDLVEKSFMNALQNEKNTSETSWITNFVNQKDDDKLDMAIKKEKQLTRLVLANYAIETISANLNGFKGKQAFVLLWAFESLLFLFYSIIFFSFANIELYKISSTNFLYTGTHINFDFFYYTLKTITFGDIDLIKPKSITARAIEIASFVVLGIFALVILTSVILSLKQEKVNENIKIATKVCEEQNRKVAEYTHNNFGTDIKTAFSEIKTIDGSLKNLKKLIDKLF